MSQVPFVFNSAYTAYLNSVKTAITTVHLVKNFKEADLYASVVGAQSMANITVDQVDMSVTTIGEDEVLVINPKSGLSKTSDSELHFTGQATSGTGSSITKTSAAWPDYTDKVVHITGGTGAGQTGKITSVSGDVLNFDAATFATPPDATSDFDIRDDLWTVYVSGSEVVYAVNETTDKAIAAASSDQVNISATTIYLPKLKVKA